MLSEQMIKDALVNEPEPTGEKSWIYKDQVPLETGGCKPSNIVNSGELPVVKVVGHGKKKGIEFVTNELFLNVPELYPFQTGES